MVMWEETVMYIHISLNQMLLLVFKILCPIKMAKWLRRYLWK